MTVLDFYKLIYPFSESAEILKICPLKAAMAKVNKKMADSIGDHCPKRLVFLSYRPLYRLYQKKINVAIDEIMVRLHLLLIFLFIVLFLQEAVCTQHENYVGLC